MYANVGAQIKQRAVWNIRVKSWILAAIITLPFLETLVFRILNVNIYLYGGVYYTYLYYYNRFCPINYLFQNIILASFIPYDLQNIILYPLENIVRILIVRSKSYNYNLYNIVSCAIQFLKVIAVFFGVRTWLKKSYIKMYAFGEIVENVSQIKNDLINRKRV